MVRRLIPEPGAIVGMHRVTYPFPVTDAHGCTGSASASVAAAPALLVLTATPAQPPCYGQTGSVSLSAVGGTGPYTYSTSNLAGVGGGTYNYSVTDREGVRSDHQCNHYVPTAVSGTTTSTPSGCGVATGSATVIPAGGTPAIHIYGLQAER